MKEEITENERLEMEVENKLAYTLAKVYVLIPWKKIQAQNAHTFFTDRIRSSASSANFKQFLENLTMKCQVPFVKIDMQYINFLDENRSITMNLIRKESLTMANFAFETVDIVKSENKMAATGQKTL